MNLTFSWLFVAVFLSVEIVPCLDLLPEFWQTFQRNCWCYGEDGFLMFCGSICVCHIFWMFKKKSSPNCFSKDILGGNVSWHFGLDFAASFWWRRLPPEGRWRGWTNMRHSMTKITIILLSVIIVNIIVNIIINIIVNITINMRHSMSKITIILLSVIIVNIIVNITINMRHSMREKIIALLSSL